MADRGIPEGNPIIVEKERKRLRQVHLQRLRDEDACKSARLPCQLGPHKHPRRRHRATISNPGSTNQIRPCIDHHCCCCTTAQDSQTSKLKGDPESALFAKKYKTEQQAQTASCAGEDATCAWQGHVRSDPDDIARGFESTARE